MRSAAEKPIEIELEPATREAAGPPCPVDRLPRRRRNRLCINVIAIGLLNFLAYTVSYAVLGGDAHNGERRIVTAADGSRSSTYFVRGHFIRMPDGQERQVGRLVWVYSYLHSISVLLTSSATIVAMLVLARPHIIATMRDGWISGQTFVTIFGTMVVFIGIVAAATFCWDFASQLAKS